MAAGEVSTVSTAWAVFSVIGGSIISAIVSFLVARRTAKAAKAQRDADRYEVRRMLAYSLLYKMIRMHSTIGTINASMQANVEKTEKEKLRLWQVVLPFGNLPDKVKLSPEEMTLVLSLDAKLFNDIGPYDDIHNSLLALCKTYEVTRETTMSKFGATMNGNLGTTDLTPDEAAWLAPRAAQLEMIAASMVNYAAKETFQSRELLKRINALFVKEFKFNPDLTFREPSAD